MSEPIPEAIPTSQDPRSKRPTKRRALTPNGQQAASVEALFANPGREIVIPDSATPKARTLAPPPEIVQNVQGSSAGAGSGEFHVYKASRRREYERLRLMDEESKKEQGDADFAKEQDERRRRDEEKTRKNREKRDKAKKRKARGREGTPSEDQAQDGDKPRPAKGPRVVVKASEDDQKTAEQNGDADGAGDDAQASTNPEEIGITIHDDD